MAGRLRRSGVSPAPDGLRHQITEEQFRIGGLGGNAMGGEPATDIHTIAMEVRRALRVCGKIDNLRQQIAITRVNQSIAEETLRATISTTTANVRNAYWDLAYARAAVDVARRSLELADKLVEDNRARVEVGTLAPIDVVQAEAEAANRRQTLAQAEATLATAQLALKRLIVTGTT